MGFLSYCALNQQKENVAKMPPPPHTTKEYLPQLGLKRAQGVSLLSRSFSFYLLYSFTLSFFIALSIITSYLI